MNINLEQGSGKPPLQTHHLDEGNASPLTGNSWEPPQGLGSCDHRILWSHRQAALLGAIPFRVTSRYLLFTGSASGRQMPISLHFYLQKSNGSGHRPLYFTIRQRQLWPQSLIFTFLLTRVSFKSLSCLISRENKHLKLSIKQKRFRA